MYGFDFSKGRVVHGRFLDSLRDLDRAIKVEAQSGRSYYFDYEPGNGTKYRVLFSYAPGYDVGEKEIVMTIINFGRSMIIPGGKMDTVGQLDYMHEKLGNLNIADCYALMPLINFFLQKTENT